MEYAQEAVKKGSTAVGVRGAGVVVLGVEKKAVAKLQEERTVQKICVLDDHVIMAFAGLTADARILIKKARVECQSHKLTVEDPVTLEYITRHVAGMYKLDERSRIKGVTTRTHNFQVLGRLPRSMQTIHVRQQSILSGTTSSEPF